MLIEMHCHTSRHSPCSVIEPAMLVRRVMEKGLQGLIMTEHHYLWTDDEIGALKKEAGVDDSFVILSGQEVGTDMGHVLLFGADRTVGEVCTLEYHRWAGHDARYEHAFYLRHRF